MLGHQLGRDEASDQKDAERHDDKIVEIAKDRDEVRNQVDGRDGVGGNRQREYLGEPRRAGVAGSKLYRVHVALYGAYPLFGGVDQARCHD